MPSLFCRMAGRRREHHVRRRGGDDDQVDVGGAARRRPPAPGVRLRAPRSLVLTSGAAKWRARMPVRSTIHWSDVSMPLAASSAARSALVTRRGGRIAAGAGDAGVSCHRSDRDSVQLACARLRCPPAGPGMGDASLDAIEQVVSGRIIRAVQGLLESELVRRAVALEHQSAQAQQGCAVVPAIIHAVFEAPTGPDRRRWPPIW